MILQLSIIYGNIAYKVHLLWGAEDEFRKKHYNKELQVLVERQVGEFYEGFDQFYNKILIKSDQNLAKKWTEIKKYEVATETNLAEI